MSMKSTSKNFRIRIVYGGGVSLFAGVEAMSMNIWDFTNDELCVYELKGVSVGKGSPITVSFRGPWNEFRTLTPMSCGDFGGMARFATVFVMDKSLNGFIIDPFGRLSIEIVPFKTGWSLGFGAATGGGTFTRIFPPIAPLKN